MRLNLRDSALFSDQKNQPVIGTQKLAKARVVIARLSLKGTPPPPPHHGQATQYVRLFIHSGYRTGGEIQHARSHEILAKAVSHTTGIDSILARAHWA